MLLIVNFGDLHLCIRTRLDLFLYCIKYYSTVYYNYKKIYAIYREFVLKIY